MRGWGPGLGEAGGRLRAGGGGALGGPRAGWVSAPGGAEEAGGCGRLEGGGGLGRGAVWSPLGEGVW